MQLGFMRSFAVGCVILVSFGELGSLAQSSVYSQTLSGGQQAACDPSDPNCVAYNDQLRIQPMQNQQQPATSQGIVLQQTPITSQTPGVQTAIPSQQQQQQILSPESRLPLPLDPPTEFQQMVANSIGKMLPIYGAKLFRNPPSTFAPLFQVPVTPDYVVGPGDELILQSWGQVTLNSRFTVDRSGGIYIPQVGTVHVAGLRFDQLQPFLKAQMGKTLRNFDLNVNMGQLRSIQVFVVGQARRPGTYTISSLSTLVNAIFATGGPAPQGSLRHIQLKRSGKMVVDFDLYDLLVNGDKSKDVQLLPGDVIYIPPAGPQVAVAGSVKAPAIYELTSSDSTTIGDVLEMAAGLTSVASKDKIRLERLDDHRFRIMDEVPLDAQGQATTLRDGDLLELIPVASHFKDAITLRGNVANPGRYMWKPGMRVRDLLPDKDALITRDYWLKRSQLGQPMMTYVPTCLPTTPYGIPNLRYGLAAGDDGEDSFWRYSSTRNLNLTGLPFVNGDGLANYYTDGVALSPSTPGVVSTDGSPTMTDGGLDCGRPTEVAPNYLALPNANGQYGNYNNSQVQASNVPTSPLMQNAATSNRMSTASASVGSMTQSALAGQFRPRNDVKLSEPDINWSYAVIERQSKENLTTSLLPFNLGRVVLEGDASQNLELLPGDVVTIFSKADIRVPQAEQTRFVRLEGEFVSSGVYSVRPGETLRQLVKRAGGLSPEAYLYGSELTRESTRRVQQQRLNEYVDQIALQASTNASAIASRAINPQDSAAAAAAQAQSQNIISNLRQARATGRIVLELQPDANGVDQLPDLPLEDGDRFIVPRVPSTVSVDGAVYNQNSFLYDPHRRLGDYVRLAGGANRDADKSRAYVIRAGGSVISKQYSSSLRGSGFDSVRLYPGDTVVIPLNLDKGKGMRMIVDIAQIVGQFGIAIAAAHTVLQ
jgi:protein involved in polysaccharide export with SLBB domain